MPRIVVTDAAFPSLNREREVAARYGAKLEEAHCKSADDVLAAADGTHVLLVQFAQITRKVIDKLAHGATIVRYGLGLDNIDLNAARERGVRVAYIPDYATGEVADHTASLILTSLRKIVPLDRSVREGTWDAVAVARPIRSFSDSTVGFIGFGRIARGVHARLRPFGFQAIVADPFVDATTLAEVEAQAADVETLFSNADVVTLHAPLTEKTHHIVNAQRLEHMKANAIIVNTARGGLIDAKALADTLEQGRIAGAALDVFEQEPLPAASPLRNLPNIILTPHAAWYSASAIEKLQALAADEVERALTGKPARCPAPVPA